ncbi:DEAD-box ATP-dependent RNA helicase [Puccinia graminis f. sp. tritici]|uniref:DEAD-box ATP-dependent RNA helicase n=1 Tax=Puccinia graminis f. sp. tritici TaxID=56615 RepID=A0A5B0QYB8_PUCGR|nr:DEAD-box ATP-dependent RNA helicase [Puccinia graminis f. sp. tritici]KAA1118312.1 DEAD-box ATP-dependent RNA helicase [Puccinia graminis f. sp. tritici]
MAVSSPSKLIQPNPNPTAVDEIKGKIGVYPSGPTSPSQLALLTLTIYHHSVYSSYYRQPRSHLTPAHVPPHCSPASVPTPTVPSGAWITPSIHSPNLNANNTRTKAPSYAWFSSTNLLSI